MSVMPCVFAQHRLSSAPVSVLQVFSATPVQPNSRPSRTNRQSCALSSRKSGLRALTARSMALFHFTLAQQAAVSAAYRTALTGCFLLSGVVMTLAFILVLGLPEILLRSEIEETSAV